MYHSSCMLQPVRNVIDIINECFFKFLHNSPKRQARISVQYNARVECSVRNSERQAFSVCDLDISFPTATQSKLKGLCHTCWVEHREAYKNVIKLIPAIVFKAF